MACYAVGAVKPEVRASWSKLTMARVKQLGSIERARVLSEVGPMRAVVRDAALLSWLDVGVQVELCEALERALGLSGARKFWHGFMLDAFDRALLKPVLVGARAMYGGGTLGYIRMAPRVHALATRGVGELRVEGTENSQGGSAVIDAKYMPLAALRGQAFALAYCGTCLAVFDLGGVSGDVELDLADAEKGRARISLSWKVRR